MFLKTLLRSFGIGDGRIPPNIALIPVCAGVFVAADDQTVIVTILPEVLLDLGVQLNELDSGAWTITAYLLGYVAAMPLMGRGVRRLGPQADVHRGHDPVHPELYRRRLGRKPLVARCGQGGSGDRERARLCLFQSP